MNDQQEQALDYFRTHAADWRAKATGAEVNIIKFRNDFVIKVARARRVRAFLDVGCGTGELVHEMAADCDATGVDYAQEMIDLAGQKPGRFVCASIFDFDMGEGRYDLISANGFIEYLSQPQMLTFFDRAARALTPGGSFVVGSRNRLFNLVSMNSFTLDEWKSGDFELLLREAVSWTQGNTDDSHTAAALQAPETEHADTGVAVTTRFQYTPRQLGNLLKDRGLQTREVYPVHVHVNPKLDAQAHVAVSNLLQSYAGNSLIVNASSFMLHATKS
jgi:2-polyprenyl-3-methyl-5-hydroxy-6-metoxy-1,4-benzoquinol methylase